jgi:hypothetical protein
VRGSKLLRRKGHSPVSSRQDTGSVNEDVFLQVHPRAVQGGEMRCRIDGGGDLEVRERAARVASGGSLCSTLSEDGGYGSPGRAHI